MGRSRQMVRAIGALALVGGLVGAGVIVAAPVASAAGTDLYVATTGTDSPNTCTNPSSPCLTIGYAVSQAASGDTIHVAAGTYTTTSTVTLNQNVAVAGAGAASTIVGGTSSTPVPGPVFAVGLGETVSVTGLTITEGGGGGITNNNGTIETLSGDTFTENGPDNPAISNMATIDTLSQDTIT